MYVVLYFENGQARKHTLKGLAETAEKPSAGYGTDVGNKGTLTCEHY